MKIRITSYNVCYTKLLRVAIDWADRQHAFALEDAATGRRQTGSIEHTPEAVASWVAALLEGFGGGPIALALEQSRGALV